MGDPIAGSVLHKKNWAIQNVIVKHEERTNWVERPSV